MKPFTKFGLDLVQIRFSGDDAHEFSALCWFNAFQSMVFIVTLYKSWISLLSCCSRNSFQWLYFSNLSPSESKNAFVIIWLELVTFSVLKFLLRACYFSSFHFMNRLISIKEIQKVQSILNYDFIWIRFMKNLEPLSKVSGVFSTILQIATMQWQGCKFFCCIFKTRLEINAPICRASAYRSKRHQSNWLGWFVKW